VDELCRPALINAAGPSQRIPTGRGDRFRIKRGILLERLARPWLSALSVSCRDSGSEQVLAWPLKGCYPLNGPGDPAAGTAASQLAEGLLAQADLPTFAIWPWAIQISLLASGPAALNKADLWPPGLEPSHVADRGLVEDHQPEPRGSPSMPPLARRFQVGDHPSQPSETTTPWRPRATGTQPVFGIRVPPEGQPGPHGDHTSAVVVALMAGAFAAPESAEIC